MDQQHRPTARVLDILELLATASGGFTLTEIAAAIDAPKSTISPILQTLQRRRFVSLDKTSAKYSVGVAAYALAANYLDANPLQRFVMDTMRHVVDGCSEICQLGVLDKGDVLYIGKVDSPEPIRLVSHVGKRLPAPCTALGKALLCDHSREMLRNLYPDGLPVLTPRGISDMDRFVELLKTVRDGDFATDDGESSEHVMCFALPLRKHGVINAALSVSFPVFRNTPEKHALITEHLRLAQRRIQEAMDERNEGLSPPQD